MFIELINTRRNGVEVPYLVDIADIATVAGHGEGCIVTLHSSDFEIWSKQSFAEVQALIPQDQILETNKQTEGTTK